MNEQPTGRILRIMALACVALGSGVLFFLSSRDESAPIVEDAPISGSAGGGSMKRSAELLADDTKPILPVENPLLIVRETGSGELLVVLNPTEGLESPLEFEVSSERPLSFSESSGLQVEEISDKRWAVRANASSDSGGQTLLIAGISAWLTLDLGALPQEMLDQAQFGPGLRPMDGVVRALVDSPQQFAKE